uniref:Uncharacterized protein n=1 Tax=Glossina palpalis gambiensis TaxID=67801 RepID=A0A1B0BLE0_9MUSC
MDFFGSTIKVMRKAMSIFFIDPSSLEAVINEANLAVYVRDINKANNHQKAVQRRREEALQVYDSHHHDET